MRDRCDDVVRHLLRETVLWVGALLGLLAVAAGSAVAFFGFSFLVFRSGSMEPEIPTGALGLSRTVAATDIEVGDVVSVVAASGERITHRVVGSTVRDDEASLVLRGDANAAEDAEVYVVRSAERVVASVPYAGYVVAHVLAPPGLLAVGCLSLMLVVIGFTGPGPEDRFHARPPVRQPQQRPRHRATPSNRRVVVGAGCLLVIASAGTVAGPGTARTLAAFTDRPTAATGRLAALSVPAPVLSCAATSTTALTISWPASTQAGVGYTASISSSAGSSALPIATSGSTRSVQVTAAEAPGQRGSTTYHTVAVVARTTASAAWASTSRYDISTTRPDNNGKNNETLACVGPA